MTTPSRDATPFPAAQSWLIDNPITRAMAQRFVGGLDLRQGMRVLDVGCGPGRLTLPVARAVGSGGEVLAVDLQKEMLARVEKRAAAAGITNIRTLRATAGEAGLTPQAFDLALMAYVLGEIPHDRRQPAMREIASALRPGGRLVVAEGVMDPHRQTPEAVRALAESAGLRLDGVRSGPFGTVITLRPAVPLSPASPHA